MPPLRPDRPTRRVLALDGGGIHGLFTLEVLAVLEQRLRDLAQLTRVELYRSFANLVLGYLLGGNFGRGFPQYVRAFNANFLALPALPSERLPEACEDKDIVVRAIRTSGNGRCWSRWKGAPLSAATPATCTWTQRSVPSGRRRRTSSGPSR